MEVGFAITFHQGLVNCFHQNEPILLCLTFS